MKILFIKFGIFIYLQIVPISNLLCKMICINPKLLKLLEC